jgi:deazaflavin-dependent oxidoreductase (nitroreductase family)
MLYLSAMGLLTPVARKIGSISWMPKLLPQIVWLDKLLHRITGGRIGLLVLAGLPGLTLTVPGRKSGVPRSTELLCIPYEGGWLIAGSSFGAPKPPVWAGNLRATQTASVTWKRREIPVEWRELEGDDRARAWAAMLELWPNYDMYAANTDRVIPVFHLTPA